jgi:hypothetical protein
MNKIIEVALKGKFGTENVTELMEVIMETPNPEMATEILLGIWTKPTVYHSMYRKDKFRKLSEEPVMCFANDINLWEGVVSYTYEKPETKNIYVPKDTDESLVTIENYEEFACDYTPESGCKNLTIPTGKMRQVNDTCTLKEWMSWDKIEETE